MQPAGDDGVRIREVVDEDFGTKDRHGYERIIPNDFGEPTDIEASSPDANADIDVTPGRHRATASASATPTPPFSGQHRYVLSLHAARRACCRPASSLSTSSAPTRRWRPAGSRSSSTGLELDDPKCNVGAAGSVRWLHAGTRRRRVPGGHQPAEARRRASRSAAPSPAASADRRRRRPAAARRGAPTIGWRSHWRRSRWVLIGCRRRVRRHARDAGPQRGVRRRRRRRRVRLAAIANRRRCAAAAVRLVADSKMAELATIEFVPPKGIEPWQGAVLLNEKIDRTTVAAWVSGLVAKDAITLTKDDGDLVLHRGPHFDRLDAETGKARRPDARLQGRAEARHVQRQLRQAWNEVQRWRTRHDRRIGLVEAPAAGQRRQGGSAAAYIVIVVVVAVRLLRRRLVARRPCSARSAARSPALIFAIVVPVDLRPLPLQGDGCRPAAPPGSALALRAESFRRFLAASEGQHVDWAWKQGLLREYSAWAVALGAADAWGRALANSNVPAPEMNMRQPDLAVQHGPVVREHAQCAGTIRRLVGGSSFGGFSGGSVGGGGGGGSSGSW